MPSPNSPSDEAGAQKEKFTRNLVHDMRTHLSVAIGNLDFLLSGEANVGELNKEQEERLRTALLSLTNVVGLLNLVTFADQGRTSPSAPS